MNQDNKEYIYYWYHHMMDDKRKNYIQTIINNHNYEAFIKEYKRLSIEGIKLGKFDEEFNSWFPIIFLPDTISVYDKNTNEIEYISVLDKDNFNKITYSECECG